VQNILLEKKWLVMSNNIQRYQAGLTDILNVKKKSERIKQFRNIFTVKFGN